MNIVMIDPDILPKKAAADSFEKSRLLWLFEENRKRRIFLSKEFCALGANLLLVVPRIVKEKKPTMELIREGEVNKLVVNIFSLKSDFISSKEVFEFSKILLENSAAISGVFLPDLVILGGSFSFCGFAAKRIAKDSGAELFCEFNLSPEVIKRIFSGFKKTSVLTVLKKEAEAAIDNSSAMLGFYPDSKKRFLNAHSFYPMYLPGFYSEKRPSTLAFSAYDRLSAFREGKTFVLSCAVPLEDGFSAEELIEAAASFDKKLAVVFLLGGTKEKKLKRLASEKNATNVFFMEDVPFDELPFILSASDAVFLAEDISAKGALPLEQWYFSAFYAKKPVIAAAERDFEFFKKSGGTIITKPKNKESIRLGIKSLLEMPDYDLKLLGTMNEAFAEKHSQENFSKEYFSLIDNLVNQKES